MMDVKKTLHMKAAGEEDDCYQHNLIAVKIVEGAIGTIGEAVAKTYADLLPEKLNIADLGCGVGPNPILVLNTIISSVKNKCKELNRLSMFPEIQLFLNDLTGNNFDVLLNDVFVVTEDLKKEKGGRDSLFVATVQGSFHGRLFPQKSLHFVNASCSVHFLSKVPRGVFDQNDLPLNKGTVYFSNSTPDSVLDSYFSQFKDDFMAFLKSRGEEIVGVGGRLVIVILCRKVKDPREDVPPIFVFMDGGLRALILKGLVSEEEVDRFNLPFHVPSLEEVAEVVKMEGSFVLEHVKFTGVQLDSSEVYGEDPQVIGRRLSGVIRSFSESMVVAHFGEEVLDEYYNVALPEFIINVIRGGGTSKHNMMNTCAYVLKKK